MALGVFCKNYLKLSQSHEVWVYTTSLRNSLSIKIWFRLWGVNLSGVVNYQHHQKVVSGTKYSNFSKAQGAFGIDVIVDDKPGVALECQAQGCKSIIVGPEDPNWENTVLNGLKC